MPDIEDFLESVTCADKHLTSKDLIEFMTYLEMVFPGRIKFSDALNAKSKIASTFLTGAWRDPAADYPNE